MVTGNLSKWMETPLDGVGVVDGGGATGSVDVGSVACGAVVVGMAVVVEKGDNADVPYPGSPYGKT